MTLFFDKISQHYEYVLLLGICITAVGYFGTFFSYESPIWLIRAGRLEEAKKILKKISDVNGVDCDREIWELS
jgi:hypothetical protein